MRSIAILGVFDAKAVITLNPSARTYRVIPMNMESEMRVSADMQKQSARIGGVPVLSIMPAAIPASDFGGPASFKKAER